MFFYLPFYDPETGTYRYVEVSGDIVPAGDVPEGAPTLTSGSAAAAPPGRLQGAAKPGGRSKSQGHNAPVVQPPSGGVGTPGAP